MRVQGWMKSTVNGSKLIFSSIFSIFISIFPRQMESTSRFFSPPADHFFLLGPRGTGKTWWTKQRYPDALRVDLLEPAVLRELAARPERLREMAGAHRKLKQIVIDEVQKLPSRPAHSPFA